MGLKQSLTDPMTVICVSGVAVPGCLSVKYPNILEMSPEQLKITSADRFSKDETDT